jgi:hypothetical protein
MLKMTEKCERCGVELRENSLEAMICSFVCTFCKACADDALNGRCPKCGGELIRRLVRTPS